MTYSVQGDVFEGLFSTHVSECLTYSLKVPHLHDIVCTQVNFSAYFVYLLLLGELVFIWLIFYGLQVVQVPQYTSPLVTYCVHKKFLTAYTVHIPSNIDLIFILKILYEHVHVRLLTYSVHIPPLGDLLLTFRWYILYTHHPILTFFL